MRSNWRTADEEVPGWTPWQLGVACVFPALNMQDEVDQLELGDLVWIYLNDSVSPT